MEVLFRRKVSEGETKTQVSAELQVDGGMYEFSGGLDVAVNNARSDSKTEIEVQYSGANN
jgi:hypothetical protein